MSKSIERSTVLLIMTSGRKKYLEETMDSFDLNVGMQSISRVVINDDSGNEDFTQWLHDTFWDAEIISSGKPSGFGGAIRRAWKYLKETKQPEDKYIFHLEEDFTFNEIISIEDMKKDMADSVVQSALKRQPWNQAEIEAGGVMELNPSAYKQQGNNFHHRLFFTTNPSLYRYDLVNGGWPQDPYSEGKFWHGILSEGLPYNNLNPDLLQCIYYRGYKELVTHIGVDRANGFGY